MMFQWLRNDFFDNNDMKSLKCNAVLLSLIIYIFVI